MTTNLQGTWIGEYELPPAPNQLISRVGFTIRIRHLAFRSFTGTVQDDPREGMPDPGTIEGGIEGAHVTFIKQMPVCYVGSPEGMIKHSDWLRNHGYEADDLPHPPIHYTGKYLADQDAIAGTWTIHGQLCDVESSGSFWMKRRSTLV